MGAKKEQEEVGCIDFIYYYQISNIIFQIIKYNNEMKSESTTENVKKQKKKTFRTNKALYTLIYFNNKNKLQKC